MSFREDLEKEVETGLQQLGTVDKVNEGITNRTTFQVRLSVQENVREMILHILDTSDLVTIKNEMRGEESQDILTFGLIVDDNNGHTISNAVPVTVTVFKRDSSLKISLLFCKMSS